MQTGKGARALQKRAVVGDGIESRGGGNDGSSEELAESVVSVLSWWDVRFKCR